MNQKGSALIPVMIVSVAVAIACTAAYQMIIGRVKTNQTLRSYAARDAFASMMDRTIRNPDALTLSLYDSTCVQNALQSGGTAALSLYDSNSTGYSSCFGVNKTTVQGTASYDLGLTTFNLYAPGLPTTTNSSPTPIQVAGTETNPVYYETSGQTCTQSSGANCQFKAIAMYDTSGAGDSTTGLPSIIVQYKVLPIDSSDLPKLAAQQIIVNSNAVTTQAALAAYSGQAIVPYSTLSRVADPNNYASCSGSSSQTYGSIAYNVVNPQQGSDSPRNPASSLGTFTFTGGNEQPQCTDGIGQILCKRNEFQVGINPDGSPICEAIIKNDCTSTTNGYGSGFIAVGNSPTGNTIGCMKSYCQNLTGFDTSNNYRIGFVSPKANETGSNGDPTYQVNCIILQPTSSCLTYAKTQILSVKTGSDDAGSMPCLPDSTTIPAGTPHPAVPLSGQPITAVYNPVPPPTPTPPPLIYCLNSTQPATTSLTACSGSPSQGQPCSEPTGLCTTAVDSTNVNIWSCDSYTCN
jgi:hypothetical protein